MLRFIFDLDRTIFDTQRYADDQASSFADFGLHRERFFATIPAAYTIEGRAGYSVEQHLRILGNEMSDVSPEAIRSAMRKRARTYSHGYAYPDVRDTLQQLADERIPTHIVTLGVPSEQQFKYEVSGLAPYITSFTCTRRGDARLGKIPAMATVAHPGDTTIHVNDSPSEIKSAAQAFPAMQHFLIQSFDTDQSLPPPENSKIVHRLQDVLQAVGLGA